MIAKKTSKETRLGGFLVKSWGLNKERVKRHARETPTHLRFTNGCGINSFSELKNKLEALGLEHKKNTGRPFSRSPDYIDQGLVVSFENENVGVQYNVQKEGRIARKHLSPNRLNLQGKTFTNSVTLRKSIVEGVHNLDNFEFADCLISMLDNVDNKGPIKGLDNVEPQDKNRIASDFGETLGAYRAIGKGNKITFPGKGNNSVADYYENDQPVSAKGPDTGGKVNLAKYKTLIDDKTTTGKFLYSLASHNKNDFFKYAAELCKEVNSIAEMVGGTSVIKVEQFVRKIRYDDFYDYISKTPEHRGLGVPKNNKQQQQRVRELWDKGRTDPFYFTINTLTSRLWGQSKAGVEKISPVVVKFLKASKFVTISFDNNNVVFNDLLFEDASAWKTRYWGRTTNAWCNYMGVEPESGLE